MSIKILIGQKYVGVRFKNDLFVGVGRPSAELLSGADRSRPYGPKTLLDDVPEVEDDEYGYDEEY